MNVSAGISFKQFTNCSGSLGHPVRCASLSTFDFCEPGLLKAKGLREVPLSAISALNNPVE